MRRASTAGALLAVIARSRLVAPAAGHGFYVDDDVVASGDCQSIPTACKTIADALASPEPDPGTGRLHRRRARAPTTENVVLDNPGG